MSGFYNGMSPDEAGTIEHSARLVFDLRENRDQLLNKYAVADVDALKEKILAGEVGEHPAYEDYLSIRILLDTRETIRRELQVFLQEL